LYLCFIPTVATIIEGLKNDSLVLKSSHPYQCFPAVVASGKRCWSVSLDVPAGLHHVGHAYPVSVVSLMYGRR
jgi:hypothetical protein